jgi:hypothetical protein
VGGGQVQAVFGNWLRRSGWLVTSMANTATKAQGVDLLARKGDRRLGAEVKGWPFKGYADPRRASDVKRTRPTTQAGHWFGQALMKAMMLLDSHPATSLWSYCRTIRVTAIWLDERRVVAQQQVSTLCSSGRQAKLTATHGIHEVRGRARRSEDVPSSAVGPPLARIIHQSPVKRTRPRRATGSRARRQGAPAGKYRVRLCDPQGVPGARFRWRGGAGGGRARPAA